MTKYLFGLRLKDTYDTALLKKNKNIKGIVDSDRIATEFVKSHQFTKIYNEAMTDVQHDMFDKSKNEALKREFEDNYKMHSDYIDYIDDEAKKYQKKAVSNFLANVYANQLLPPTPIRPSQAPPLAEPIQQPRMEKRHGQQLKLPLQRTQLQVLHDVYNIHTPPDSPKIKKVMKKFKTAPDPSSSSSSAVELPKPNVYEDKKKVFEEMRNKFPHADKADQASFRREIEKGSTPEQAEAYMLNRTKRPRHEGPQAKPKAKPNK